MIGLGIGILLFLLLGVLFFRGKGGFLIAGWNTMSPEERARYDEKAVFRNMSALMFSCAGCMVLLLLGEVLDLEILNWIGALLLVFCVVFFIVRVNTAGRK